MSREREDLHGLTQEFIEAQRAIDKMARGTVESMKKMTAARETLTAGRSEAFAATHGAWYDAAGRDLAAAAFRLLGDFEDANNLSAPDERRSFYRIALSDDGTTAAFCFVVPTQRPLQAVVLQTWHEDGGTTVTLRGLTELGVPRPPTERVQFTPPDTPLPALLARHLDWRAGNAAAPRTARDIADVQAWRDQVADHTAAHRKSLDVRALFEPWLRTMVGDEWEDRGQPILDSIVAHPWWWTGETPAPALMFLMSRNEKTRRGHITTVGMMPFGLPELQIKDLAANHCLAARAMLGLAAKALLAITAGEQLDDPERQLSGRTLTLEPLQPPPPSLASVPGRAGFAVARCPVEVRVVLEGFSGRKRGLFSFLQETDPKLLRVLPAGQVPDLDRWLADACRKLGYLAPDALPAGALDEQMSAMSKAGRARLPELRTRFLAGLPEDDHILIKTGLAVGNGREYVWVSVREWNLDGTIAGQLESRPQGAEGYTQGQQLRVHEDDVFDVSVLHASAGSEPAFTDIVAQEFGVDLPDSG